MKTLEFIEKIIEEKSTRIIEANDQIWEFAELAYHEYQSAGLLCQFLKDEGFTVETGLAGIPTCFQGTYSYGCGKPVVGILGEYDALSGLNQAAACPSRQPIIQGAPGHGCGHSALGAGALAAAIAVKEYLKTFKKSGTVIYFGCPAEEGAVPNSSWPEPGCSIRWILFIPGTRTPSIRWTTPTITRLWEPISTLKALLPTPALPPIWAEAPWTPQS